jgi:hypothetical protein
MPTGKAPPPSQPASASASTSIEHKPELDRDGADGEKEELPALQFCMPLGAAPPPSQPASASTSTSSEHKPRCDCGCVPPIKSMFEMAELRKQARLKKAADSK